LPKLSPKFSVKKAHEMQLRLSKKLIFEDTLPDVVDYVAGVDVAYLETRIRLKTMLFCKPFCKYFVKVTHYLMLKTQITPK